MPLLYSRPARRRAARRLLATLARLAARAWAALLAAADRDDPAAGALWFRIRARIARRVREVVAWVNAAA